MKAIKFLAVAALVAAPALSFAQSTQGVTRAQVRAELIQLEQAGYNPASDETQYPTNIQAAEARIHAGDAAATTSSAYGGMNSGAAHAGTRMSASASNTDDVTGLGPVFKNP